MGRHKPLRATHTHRFNQSPGHRSRHRSGNGQDGYSPYESHPGYQRIALNNANLLPEALFGALEQQPPHETVWQWLSQTDNQEDDNQHNKRSHQDQVNEHHHHRSHQTHVTQSGGPTGRPRHITSTAEHRQLSPLTTTRHINSGRRRPTSTDSSIISGFQPRQEISEKGVTLDSTQDCSTTSRGPYEELPAHQFSSPPATHPEELTRFEKRPRYKTREDKYDSKKRKTRHKQESTGKAKHKTRQKPEKKRKKAVTSGKNIMNNFTSGAVLNDRITVRNTMLLYN